MNDHVEHQPLRELVAGQIRAMIIDGELAQGERLVEGQLAERLGVSRNPVREAIRSLEATGLVEVVPRKGAYVCVIDYAEVRQIQELRILVEGYAVEQAASNRGDDDMRLLQEILANGRDATANGDQVAAATCHRDFHLVIEGAAGNQFIEQILNPLRHQTELVFSVVLDSRGAITWEEHEAIFDAVRDQDGESARSLTQRHIMNALEIFEQAAGAGTTSQS